MTDEIIYNSAQIDLGASFSLTAPPAVIQNNYSTGNGNTIPQVNALKNGIINSLCRGYHSQEYLGWLLGDYAQLVYSISGHTAMENQNVITANILGEQLLSFGLTQ